MHSVARDKPAAIVSNLMRLHRSPHMHWRHLAESARIDAILLQLAKCNVDAGLQPTDSLLNNGLLQHDVATSAKPDEELVAHIEFRLRVDVKQVRVVDVAALDFAIIHRHRVAIVVRPHLPTQAIVSIKV